MRKFVSVVAILAMLFALAVPAFADGGEGSSVVFEGSDTVVQLPDRQELPDGGYYEVYGYPMGEEGLTTPQKDSVDDAAVKAAGDGATVGDIFEIDGYVFDADGEFEYMDPSKGGTITIVYDGEGDVAGVLYWNDLNGAWDYAPATKNADGTYSATLKHFCAAALVITPKKATTPAPAQKPAGSTSTGTKSPQTGFDATVYMMVTATLVLFAGFCFVKARKVTE